MKKYIIRFTGYFNGHEESTGTYRKIVTGNSVSDVFHKVSEQYVITDGLSIMKSARSEKEVSHSNERITQ